MKKLPSAVFMVADLTEEERKKIEGTCFVCCWYELRLVLCKFGAVKCSIAVRLIIAFDFAHQIYFWFFLIYLFF